MKLQGLLTVLCFTLTLVSCNSELPGPVYVPDRTWTFTVANSDSAHIDTLTLDVVDETWNTFQTKIIWHQRIHHATGSTEIEEHTGVIDKPHHFLLPNEVWLHPYRSSYMRLTELVSFPQLKYPITDGQVVESTITPKHGWEELEGIEVRGRVTVTGKVSYKQAILKDSCWRLSATGRSTAGNYNATFYFSPTHGFVYFFYDFAKYTCTVDLVSVNF
jgi:hypothetical protein